MKGGSDSKRHVFILFGITTCILFVWYHYYYCESHNTLVPYSLSTNKDNDRVLTAVAGIANDINETDNRKVIFLWNKFFRKENFGIVLEEEPFYEITCPTMSCRVLKDRSRLSEADAVIVHTFMVRENERNLLIDDRKQYPQAKFVFYIFESPLIANHHGWLNGLDDIFNLTFTYMASEETDIVAPHARLSKVKGFPLQVPSMEFVKSKTKMAAWVVSNCRPLSLRWDYVQELRRYIEVDIFGKCGNLTCPSGGPQSECFRNISRDYHFYLAFENSYCQDYITEKYFRTLVLPIVPIVFGGGNYSEHAPSNGFIDVRDFNSPANLAKHLNYLTKNMTEYIRYLEWKKGQKYVTFGKLKYQGFCRLCGILNDESYEYKHSLKARDYWNDTALCLNGSEEAQVVHL